MKPRTYLPSGSILRCWQLQLFADRIQMCRFMGQCSDIFDLVIVQIFFVYLSYLSHCCHIFRGCVSRVVGQSYSVIYCVYVPGCWDFVSIIDVQSMVRANNCVHNDPRVLFVCLHTTVSHCHHCTDTSKGIELLKWLSGMCRRVCVRDRVTPRNYLLFNTCCCVSLACPVLLWWSWDCVTLSYYHHQSMNGWPLCKVRSWSNVTRCMSHCVLIRNSNTGYTFKFKVYQNIMHTGQATRFLLCFDSCGLH